MVTVLNQWVTATDRIDRVRLSFLRWLATEDQARADRYRDYREYYDGDHETQLTDRQRRYLQLKSGVEFRDNYCPIVVDALAERLTVTGFDAGEQSSVIWDWWRANGMDKEQGPVHTGAIRDGDDYVLVDWDNEDGQPRFTFEMAYDGTEGVKLHYDPEHRKQPAYASKRWRIDQGPDAGSVRRMNLYYPDRIERYISTGQGNEGQWRVYSDEGEEVWPLPWVASDSSPLGVPVIHFKNRDEGYNYGQSELKDVVPLQNAVNKSLIDLLAAADTTGFRLYTMTGADPGGMEIVPGKWIYAEDSDVKIGSISGENLDGLIRVKDSLAMEIARISRTPLSFFQISGHRPAEGTLKAEEAPLVSKARDRMVGFGDSWADAMAMARRLANAFGNAGMDEKQIIETIWKDPESRNEEAHLKSLRLKAELGVPIERIWSEMGYDSDTIDEMRALRGEEMAASSNLGGELLRAFEGGR